MSRFLLFVCMLLAGLNATAQRMKYNFNQGWKVLVSDPVGAEKPEFPDQEWKNVTLPYAWNEDDAFRKDIRDLRTGIAWYRKHFKLPSSGHKQKVFIEFEGVRQAADIYVNGKKIGFHENGVMAFGYDISDHVFFGNEENVIAVRTNNDWDYRERATGTKHQWADKNFNANYGGIPKNVYLHVTGEVYQTLPLYSSLKTSGVYVYATEFDIKGKKAVVHAESEVKNETGKTAKVAYKVLLSEKNGKRLASFSGETISLAPGETGILKAAAPVSGLSYWSWGYGYLYNVETVLEVNGKVVDRISTTTGFRKTDFRDGMIFLNDRVIMVHGYAQRTSNEWPAIGMSVPAWLSDYSNRLMVESNGNLVRWMHITPWKQDVESCDRVGLMQAMPAGDAERDVTGRRWEQRTEVMRDAIIYNRNNPSIIFYECGNESISEEHMREMKAIRDQYDPHGGRAIGSREMLDSETAEYGGEMLYTNKSADIPMWAMEYSRDEGSRKYWDEYSPPFHKDGDGPLYKEQDASAYNRNQDSHAKENIARWYEFWRERPGMGKRVSAGGVNIVFSETNTHYRGEDNYRRSGEVDALRIPKENFYAHQVMWDGWVEVENPAAHIIGHWNYAPGVVKDVFVVSSAKKVDLFVNGRKQTEGRKTDGFLFTFSKIAFEPGTISAVGYDEKGKKICSAEKSTAGKPVAVKLSLVERPTPWLADAQDLVLVEVEVVDEKGQRCPTALNMIDFSVSGPVEWKGGMAKGPDNYIGSTSLPLEAGVNRVLLRSTDKAGNISLNAKAEGLRPATLQLATKAYSASNGLSVRLPSDGLPMNLERGPAPTSPSFTHHRRTVGIIAAKAGANDSLARNSYDDNELSAWRNNGELNSAWIQYTLAEAATISEIGIKLNGFRSRRYPLKITLDGQTIFEGETQTTLGYYNIPCTPLKGSEVRISLIGSSVSNQQVFMKEVGGKDLDDGLPGDKRGGKGDLNIIEVEFYEQIKQ